MTRAMRRSYLMWCSYHTSTGSFLSDCYTKNVMTKTQKIVYNVLRVILTALFLFTAFDKLRDDPMAVAGFATIGMPVWFMYVIGVGELIGGIGLWFEKTFRYAYEGLFLVLLGAIVTTWIFVSKPVTLVPLVVAILLGILVWLHNKKSTPAAM